MQQGGVCRNGILRPPPNSITVIVPEMIASQAAWKYDNADDCRSTSRRKPRGLLITTDESPEHNRYMSGYSSYKLGTRLPGSIASGIIWTKVDDDDSHAREEKPRRCMTTKGLEPTNNNQWIYTTATTAAPAQLPYLRLIQGHWKSAQRESKEKWRK
jgi:hypothetical protein